MQFNQQSTRIPDPPQQPNTGAAGSNGSNRGIDQEIARLRSRTRRQIILSGLIGGATILLGESALYNGHALLSLFNKPTCVPAVSSTSHPVKLAVAQAGKSIAFFRYYVAQQEGYFSAHGLDMADPIQMPNGEEVIAALRAGKVQIGNGVITDAFSLSRIDSTVQIIGMLLSAYAVDIVVGYPFLQQANLPANSTLAEKIQALQGKRIGITGPGTGTQALLIYLFRRQGLNAATAAHQVNLGSNSATALEALKSGSVDALSYFVPFGEIAEAKKVGSIFISPLRGDVPELVGDAQAVYYTRQSVIDANPLAIISYIRAMSQAADFIHNNPAKTKVYLTKYLGLSADVADTVYAAALPSITESPVVSQQAYSIAGQFHVKAGLVAVTPSYNQLVATNVIESALGKNTAICQTS
ncbi:MAG TPA: ABC transporter substrate-binding protein [Ktedonobacteraceae bacterium]|nr:ABC transporter substrate-binding protein [Ktedonobacteraceae bacterium]